MAGRRVPDVWDTPGARLEPRESPLQALRRSSTYYQPGSTIAMLRRLDRSMTSTRRPFAVAVYHVFAAHVGDRPDASEGTSLRWFHPDELKTRPDVCAAAIRSLAIWGIPTAPEYPVMRVFVYGCRRAWDRQRSEPSPASNIKSHCTAWT